jgi:aflatoxin B1 aldehyde reductase
LFRFAPAAALIRRSHPRSLARACPSRQEDAIEQLDYFASEGFNEIDTARMYANGDTEEMLGRVLEGRDGISVTGARAARRPASLAVATARHSLLAAPALTLAPPLPLRALLLGTHLWSARAWLSTATKANPFNGESLSKEGVREQLETSLAAMKKDYAEIFYLHAPDPDVPIEETLAEVQAMYEEGKFKQLGLSNYQSWEVTHIYHVCLAGGYVLPTIYQGMYNALTREVERELLPCLKKLGIRFVAYNPLAAGVLTGKHNAITVDAPPEGRFKDNQMYLDRYWNDTYLQLDECVKACDEAGITMTDAAFRWLKYHSMLDPSKADGIIIGASSMGHLKENVELCKAQSGPLPDNVVAALDDAWDKCSVVCPPYERGFSKL